MEEQQGRIVGVIKTKFEKKFDGNKLQFANAVGCDPKTLRDLFDGNHFMTMNLFLCITSA